MNAAALTACHWRQMSQSLLHIPSFSPTTSTWVRHMPEAHVANSLTTHLKEYASTGYPFSTYGEIVALWIQDVILVAAICRYKYHLCFQCSPDQGH